MRLFSWCLPTVNPRVAQPDLKVQLTLADVDSHVRWTVFAQLQRLITLCSDVCAARSLESYSKISCTVSYKIQGLHIQNQCISHAEMLIRWRTVCYKHYKKWNTWLHKR